MLLAVALIGVCLIGIRLLEWAGDLMADLGQWADHKGMQTEVKWLW